ncbi:F-box domain-containing protein [Artemisia annua]|uniref:F-box domain-containing protein n=1 Tax=Artemisia annua TaxID=35608 RepID=A0A2U1PW11_ARTAN|nr:F-box domain-containing protein [Artemisia annua]
MSENIPIEVQMDIVRRLSVKSVAQCRTVCKMWRSRIESMHFTKRFGVRMNSANNYVLLYERSFKGYAFYVDQNFGLTPVESDISYSRLIPLGWSHGVCALSFGPIVRHFMFLFWNPSVQKSVGAYVPYYTLGQEYEKRLLGFGVRPHNFDPIILKIAFPFDPKEPWSVQLFTLSSRSWRSLENEFLLPHTFRIKKESQANIGRHIYWCGYEKFIGNDASSYKSYVIVSFDMLSYRFQILNIPDHLLRQLPLPFCVTSIGDNLVVSGNLQGDEHCVFCIWVLSIHGGTISSFTNLLTIPSPIALKLIGFHDNIDPIIEVPSQEGFTASLFLYRMATGGFQSLGIEGDPGSFFIKPFCHSIVLQSHADRATYCQELVYPGLVDTRLNLGCH